MKLLLSGDLHIGRASARIGRRASARWQELRTARTWGRMVDMAIGEAVQAVLLSGDVADESNRFWEAIGPLERGVEQLSAQGIRTIAVAGNHDYEVLGRLANQFSGQQFTLLGQGGQWERETIEVEGRPALHIDGWSFPESHVDQNPLDDYSLAADPRIPVLGLLHGDLHDPNSRYAPLRLDQLQATSAAGWLLGHIHVPRLFEGRPWVLYPGSPQALDPGETGLHGPWIVEWHDSGLGTPRQRPLSSVWYDSLPIDLTAADDEEDVYHRVMASIRQFAASIIPSARPHLKYLLLRIQLEGDTTLAHQVENILSNLPRDLDLPVDNVSVGVEKVVNQTSPPIELNEYAGMPTAPGAVSRLLLQLQRQQPDEDMGRLLREIRDPLQRIDNASEFQLLPQDRLSDDSVRDLLKAQAQRLLAQLVNQNS